MNGNDLLGLAARLLFLVFFVRGGVLGTMRLRGTIANARGMGAPLPSLTVPISQALDWIGIVSIALGIWADVGALCLLFFLVPVTYWQHPFWRLEGQQRQLQSASFWRNVTFVGGVLLILYASRVGALPLTLTGPLFPVR
jgi:uncharacterized membrane protein YphA (DoxX/SURF4 family)